MMLDKGLVFKSDEKQKQLKKIHREVGYARYYEDSDGEITEDVYFCKVFVSANRGWNMYTHGKYVSHKREAALFDAHEEEYKEFGLKLRRKRSSSILGEPWKEVKSSFFEKGKSWKSSTKRKKQYYK